MVQQVFDIVEAINKSGTTVFMVEQNAQMALQIAHRAYVLRTGSIVLADEAYKLAETDLVKKAYLEMCIRDRSSTSPTARSS